REKNRPAAEGSSGEQKALVLNLILAQIARLADQAAAPILLLDEAPAHLDARRRAALFDEIEALGLQAFLTGTEAELFAPLRGRAQFVRVEGGGLTVEGYTLSPNPSSSGLTRGSEARGRLCLRVGPATTPVRRFTEHGTVWPSGQARG